MSWWFTFFCFDSNKWIIAHDFIKQNPLHDKIISFLFPLLPIHTVLNNIISTQILQDKSFKYYLIHNIISDSTQHYLFSLIKHINPRELDGLKECYWQLIYLSVVWFVDLLIYYLQVTEPDQTGVGNYYYKMGVFWFASVTRLHQYCSFT